MTEMILGNTTHVQDVILPCCNDVCRYITIIGTIQKIGEPTKIRYKLDCGHCGKSFDVTEIERAKPITIKYGGGNLPGA